MRSRSSGLFSATLVWQTLAISAGLLVLAIALVMATAPAPPDPANTVALATIIPNPTVPYIPSVLENDPYVPTAVPTPVPGQIGIGSMVQVTGTEGIGLRFRSSAGLAGKEVFMGFDTEAFKVIDGPRQLDGYTWYFLESANNDQRSGWAVSNYLTLLP